MTEELAEIIAELTRLRERAEEHADRPLRLMDFYYAARKHLPAILDALAAAEARIEELEWYLHGSFPAQQDRLVMEDTLFLHANTGAETLEQVREALARGGWQMRDGGKDYSLRDEALAALDGCVLLTAEEAAMVKRAVLVGRGRPITREAIALLTPTERGAS